MKCDSAVIIGIIGLLFTVIQFIKDILIIRRQTLKEYFEKGDSIEHQHNRFIIRHNDKKFEEYKEDEEFMTAISSTVQFFEYWSRLQKLGYLPLSAFKDSSGIGACKMYEVLEEYICERRKDNKFYACNFEWLCKKINKRYKKNFDI